MTSNYWSKGHSLRHLMRLNEVKLAFLKSLQHAKDNEVEGIEEQIQITNECIQQNHPRVHFHHSYPLILERLPAANLTTDMNVPWLFLFCARL